MTHRIAGSLGFAVALVVVLTAGEAAAETVYSTGQTPVYDRPGEMARIVTRVSSGTAMTVLRKPGGDTRWYKVRVNGRTGWVPRSKVSAKAGEVAVRKDRRKSRRKAFVEGRGRKRGSSEDQDAPEDRVGADTVSDDDGEEVISEDEDEEADSRPRRSSRKASRDEEEEEEEEGDEDEEPSDPNAMVVRTSAAIFAKPNRKSDEVAELDTGDQVTLIKESKSGKWLKVETASGETGWIRASEVEAPAYGRGKYAVDLMANVGASFLKQNFTSNGPQGNDLASYDYPASSIVASFGGVFTYDWKPSWLLGADLGYAYGRSPGVRYSDGVNTTDTPFTTHNLEIGGRVGYKVSKSKGMALYGRAGYYYRNVTIANFNDDEENPLLLPNENIGAFVIGLRFDAPVIAESFAAHIGVDYFLPSQLEQTAQLEDGQTADVKALTGHLRVAYHWKPKWDITGQYSYTSIDTSFSGMATRPTDATAAERTDRMHGVVLGIQRGF